MRIKNLSATGLKLGDFSHELGPVTIFTGRNFSGKTARLEAVRLALLRYVPEQGKTGAATAGLARAGAISVRLDMDDGQLVSACWRTERGAFKAGPFQVLATVPPAPPGVPPVLMDSNEYFGLGAKDQVRYVFGLARLGADRSLVVKTVAANLKNIRVENHAAEHETAIQALVQAATMTGARSLPVQEFVETLTTDFRDRLRVTKQNAARMASTVQGLTALKALDTEETIRSVDTELATLRARQTQLDGDVRLKGAEIKRLAAQAAERANLIKVLERAPDAKAQITELEREQAELMARTEGKAMQAAGLAEKRNRTQLELRQIEIEIANNERAAAEREAEHQKNVAHDTCPFCGVGQSGWKDRIISEFANEMKQRRDAIAAAKKQLKIAQGVAETIGTHYHRMIDADRALAADQQRLTQVSRELRMIRDSQKDAVALRAKLEAMGPPTESEQIEQLKAAALKAGEEHITVCQRITELSERQAAFYRAQQDTARNAQALIQHAAVTAEQAVLAEAVKLLEALQGEMVTQAFGPLLDRANRITDGILKSQIEYRDGDLGRFDGSTWITHRTFSGTEKALTYAALAAALAHESPIKLVMIDELGRLDRESKSLFIARMIELTGSGVLDQFLGCDVSSVDYGGMGCALINV